MSDSGAGSTLDGVVEVIVSTLGIADRAASLDAETELFGAMPELDSLAVLDLIASLEDRFEITIDDDFVTGDAFLTIGSLAQLVESLTS